MITDFDVRVNDADFKKFEKTGKDALNHIKYNFMRYARKPEVRGYSNTFRPQDLRDAFDEQISKQGFEIDARTLRHAYGIGNNNKWDIVDKKLNKVGTFWANDNMYQGVHIGAEVENEIIDGFEICSGGFIRE